ncbi:hypothetical protein ACWGBX_18620, partial [Streptomyces sp. NPDC055037]
RGPRPLPEQRLAGGELRFAAPAAPTTISSDRLQGNNGFQDEFFSTEAGRSGLTAARASAR